MLRRLLASKPGPYSTVSRRARESSCLFPYSAFRRPPCSSSTINFPTAQYVLTIAVFATRETAARPSSMTRRMERYSFSSRAAMVCPFFAFAFIATQSTIELKFRQ